MRGKSYKFIANGINNNFDFELYINYVSSDSIIDDNDNLVYDDTVDPSQSTTSLTIGSISTDEGVIAHLGIGEMTVRVRY